MSITPDLPQIVPLFPLSGALLLPRARLPLHVFEPRYLAMLDDALKTDHRLIGIIQPEGEGGPGTLCRVGCAGRVVSFTETSEGTYLVSLNAVSRFQLVLEEEGFTPYRRARVNWGGFETDLQNTEQKPGDFDRAGLITLSQRLFSATGESADWDLLEQASAEKLVHAIAMLAPLSPGDKQILLEAPDLTERLNALTGLIKFALHDLKRGEERLQ